VEVEEEEGERAVTRKVPVRLCAISSGRKAEKIESESERERGDGEIWRGSSRAMCHFQRVQGNAEKVESESGYGERWRGSGLAMCH